jgi:hypothetical protein
LYTDDIYYFCIGRRKGEIRYGKYMIVIVLVDRHVEITCTENVLIVILHVICSKLTDVRSRKTHEEPNRF